MIRTVLLSADIDLGELRTTLQLKAPDLWFGTLDEHGGDQAEVAVCWNPPKGSLGRLTNLKLVHSVAAGVDHLQSDPSLPDVAVCRVVDPNLRVGMSEYILWGVLHHHRQFDKLIAQQAQRLWLEPRQSSIKRPTVGVMGLGDLGSHVATTLAEFGFEVRGWARSPKSINNVSTWAGMTEFDAFLHELEYLVCLLPLTEETRGILNASTFAKLNAGAVLINCGRGGHLVQEDLIKGLESGQIRGALLDVFEVEPLPLEHALWSTAGVTITPHIASSASIDCIADQVINNIRRLVNGEELLNRVDFENGY